MNGKVPAGFTLVEVVVAASLVVGIMVLAFSGWRGHTAQLQLRYGTFQVASDLREARERAREGQSRQMIVFTAVSSAYTISRSGEDLIEYKRLPEGVTVSVNTVVTLSPGGEPDSAHTIIMHNGNDRSTVQVNPDGGISYTMP